ncbi:Otopetrin-2 [Caenorhabditis elegans]|uniref:Otopetrin-2 n=1 Tax=Caenorhabditis elegans TaxID=6239 RepID=G5EDX5_CAEEL|nr:Otopetrin-2 [Caenorhabditis elegans]CAA15637.2 Otopetrin-2 [Caenorhabditis elegans]|eukprot:NP_510045.2 OToPetrin-Like [Caenorhabditis elegans]
MLMVDEQLKIGATPMYSPSHNPIVIADDMEKGGSDSDSLPSSPTHHHELYRRPWIHEPRATNFFVRLITSLYALILTIISLVVEVSPTWRTDMWLAETIFYISMYGVGILFFAYCYIFIIYPGPYNQLISVLRKYKIIKNSEVWFIMQSQHNGEGAGTLYLRLGALFFGSVGIVLFGLELFLCIENVACKKVAIAKMIVAIVFTFIQMHFIFCNSKITVNSSRKIVAFGMMHLISVNLWTWFRFVLAKQEAKAHKKAQLKQTFRKYYSSSSSSSSEEIHELISAVLNSTLNNTPATKTMEPVASRLFALEHFGDVATFLTTCIVEYSLIGAAIMFILWKSIGQNNHQQSNSGKRKVKMRIDCSSSSTGLFAGIIFLIGSLVSMGMYTIFESLRNSSGAQLVFGIVDLSLFSIALGACIIGLWRMRHLQYRLHAHGEVIDEILLIIGLIGEILYCAVGIDVFITCRRSADLTVSALPAFVFVIRMIQVVVQAAFILTTSRLRCLSKYSMKYKPGKEIITFLLVSNVTLFVFHTFEGMKSSFGFSSKAATQYNYIIYAVGPLLVFYRFHSSACLAEIWKHTYSTKSNEYDHEHMSLSDSNLTAITPISDIKEIPSPQLLKH